MLFGAFDAERLRKMLELSLAHRHRGRCENPGSFFAQLHHLRERLGNVKRRHRKTRFASCAGDPTHQRLLFRRHRHTGMLKPDHPLLDVLQDGSARFDEDAQIFTHLHVGCRRLQQHLQNERGVFQMLRRALHTVDGFDIATVAFEHTGGFQTQNEVIERLFDRLGDVVP